MLIEITCLALALLTVGHEIYTAHCAVHCVVND